jgi:hypothetical protein
MDDDLIADGSSEHLVIALLLVMVIAFAIAVFTQGTKVRFSLRTLFLTTTAVAILLGLIIYATRS